MCDSTLATYCFIDSFLKASGYRAEVILIALTAMLHFGGNFKESSYDFCK